VIVAYVSGHGFGHATRTAEVLRKIRELAPEWPITIVSSAPEALFRRAIAGGFIHRFVECDVGLVQKDALTIDEAATAQRCRAFAADFAELVDYEWRWLRHSGARVVVGDIPPVAFQIAHEAGLPSVALANFSWDWIYRHYQRRQPALREAAEHASALYQRASLLLRLPFSGELSAFPYQESVPLVAREPRVAKPEARRRLGLRSGTAILLSFGGLGLPGFDPQVLAGYRSFQFLMTGKPVAAPPNVLWLTPEALDGAGLGYEDVVGAADVVVTKPGYGIVSDAIGARTPVVYTERGDFPEYPILVREMPRFLACAHVSNDDLMAGRLSEALRGALALEMPAAPELSGSELAARRILEIAGKP
jgi:L-arabinokinase